MSAACSTFMGFAFYSVIFGVSAGAYVGLTSVVLVDLLGLERLTNAFGILLLFQGFATFIGPPIAGNLIVCFIFHATPWLGDEFFFVRTNMKYVIVN